MKIAYLVNPKQHSNAYSTHAGVGKSEEEAIQRSCYYQNQVPWVRVVSFSRAPKWAQREAISALLSPCLACGKTHPVDWPISEPCLDSEGYCIPETKGWGAVELWDGNVLVNQTATAATIVEGYRRAGYPI